MPSPNVYTNAYRLTDHLGSTAIIANSSGALYREKRYMPWGEERYANGAMPTTFRFTGQREQEELGLYFYQSRWYDAALGRFIQPDSIIPDPYDSQSWDRYHYAGNNPLRYVDPTGHEYCNPRECGYAHDNDDDTPAPEWLQDLAEEYYQTETQSAQGGDNEGLSNVLSDVAFGADIISMGLNYGEVAVVDAISIVLLITGCASGPQGCAAALTLSAEVDYYVSSYSPLGIAENILGGLAFVATSVVDIRQGNTKLSPDEYYIGVDTLVSGRNFAIGLVPEANIDYLVGRYQVTYDNERRDGIKSGGSIEMSRDNLVEIIKSLIFGK